MRLSISNIAWNSDEEGEIREILPAYRVEGVEVAPTKIWSDPSRADSAELARYRAFWGERGLSIPALQALLFGRPELRLFADEPTRASMLSYLTSIMGVGAGLGATALVFGSPKNRLAAGLEPGLAMEIAVEFFYKAGVAACASGVVLCVEPNPPQYGCDFIRTVKEGADLVRRVDHPGFRLHVDASALILNQEDVDQAIEEAADCMAHFHISDPFLNVLGGHASAHRRMAAALRRCGWSRWISIEMRGQQGPHPNRGNIERALAFVNEVYLQ